MTRGEIWAYGMSFGGPTRLKLLIALTASYFVAQGAWGTALVGVLIVYPLMLGGAWLLDVGLPRLGRWVWRRSWIRLTGVLLLALGLSGCSDMAMHGNRLVNGVDCRPEAMQNGQCRITRGAQK